jgi:molybdopterin-binding protein
MRPAPVPKSRDGRENARECVRDDRRGLVSGQCAPGCEEFRGLSNLGLDSLSGARYHPGMRISARNRLVGKIEELQIGDVMAHVVVSVGEHVVESVISRRSVEEMNLQVGDTVAVVVQSMDVMLQKA